MAHIFVIARLNGVRKTTAAKTLLSDLLQCNEYVNADHIAGALSPFYSEATAFQAGRLMLGRIQLLAKQRKNFAFEATLASRSFVSLLRACQ